MRRLLIAALLCAAGVRAMYVLDAPWSYAAAITVLALGTTATLRIARQNAVRRWHRCTCCDSLFNLDATARCPHCREPATVGVSL